MRPTYKNPLYFSPISLIASKVGLTISVIIFLSRAESKSQEGEYAPIPPVFFPLSPSPTLL